MATNGKEVMYSEFVSAVIEVLKPAFPPGLQPIQAFTATEIIGRVLSADSATLRGAKAEAFARLAVKTCEQMGVGAEKYATYTGFGSGDTLIDHSCYTRNLRRWLSGTLPRKRKSRADFAILSTCWACAWFDPDASKVPHPRILKDIASVVRSITPDCEICPTPESLAIALWGAGQQAYLQQGRLISIE